MFRKPRRSSGTSIAGEEGNSLAWLAAAVGVGVVIVVIFMTRSDAKDDPESQAVGAAVEIDAGRVDVVEGPGPGNIPPAPTPTANRAELAAELASDLQAKRLWSEVEVDAGDESVLVVRSGSCADPGLKGSIQALSARLSAEGLVKVACYELHGALVFEQPL